MTRIVEDFSGRQRTNFALQVLLETRGNVVTQRHQRQASRFHNVSAGLRTVGTRAFTTTPPFEGDRLATRHGTITEDHLHRRSTERYRTSKSALQSLVGGPGAGTEEEHPWPARLPVTTDRIEGGSIAREILLKQATRAPRPFQC